MKSFKVFSKFIFYLGFFSINFISLKLAAASFNDRTGIYYESIYCNPYDEESNKTTHLGYGMLAFCGKNKIMSKIIEETKKYCNSEFANNIFCIGHPGAIDKDFILCQLKKDEIQTILFIDMIEINKNIMNPLSIEIFDKNNKSNILFVKIEKTLYEEDFLKNCIVNQFNKKTKQFDVLNNFSIQSLKNYFDIGIASNCTYFLDDNENEEGLVTQYVKQINKNYNFDIENFCIETKYSNMISFLKQNRLFLIPSHMVYSNNLYINNTQEKIIKQHPLFDKEICSPISKKSLPLHIFIKEIQLFYTSILKTCKSEKDLRFINNDNNVF